MFANLKCTTFSLSSGQNFDLRSDTFGRTFIGINVEFTKSLSKIVHIFQKFVSTPPSISRFITFRVKKRGNTDHIFVFERNGFF